MIKLYNYQGDLVDKIRQQIGAGKRHILVQSPTGSG